MLRGTVIQQLPAGVRQQVTRTRVAAAAGLLLLALAVRAPGLSPAGLWRDDAWQALVLRASGLAEAQALAFTAPGFAAVLLAVLHVPGDLEVLAQLVPVAASVLACPLAALAARSLGATRWSAVSAGALLALSSTAAVYGVRVKPSSLEALLALALFTVAAHGARAPSRGRWYLLHWLVALGCLVSAPLLLFGMVLLVTAAALAVLQRDATLPRRSLLLPAAVAVTVVGVVLRDVLGNVPLQRFWAGEGAYTSATAGGLWRAAERFVGLLLPDLLVPDHGSSVAVLAVLGLLAAAMARDHATVLLATAPVLAVLLLSVVERVPFGARTDLLLHPSVLVAMALGLPRRARPAPLLRWAAAGLGLCTAVALAVPVARAQAQSYPEVDMPAAVRKVWVDAQPGDVVFVDSYSTYPAYLYGLAPFRVRSDPEAFLGSSIEPRRADVVTTREPVDLTAHLGRLDALRRARRPLVVLETVPRELQRAGPPAPAYSGSEYLTGGPDPTVYTVALRSDPRYRLCSHWRSTAVRVTRWSTSTC